jgi:hypothetical protein
LALAVKVPLTLSDPEIDTLSHVRGSRPSHAGSTLPFTVKHDDITVQVPTTLPPQAVTFWQDEPPPVPPLDVPPVPGPVPPLELPPVPEGAPEVAVHAPEIVPAVNAIARAADLTFMEMLLTKWVLLSLVRGIAGSMPAGRDGDPRPRDRKCDFSENANIDAFQINYLPYPAATTLACTAVSVASDG